MSVDLIKQALDHYRFIGVSCVGLAIFLGVFIGALLWISRRGSSDFYEQMEKLPLEDKV